MHHVMIASMLVRVDIILAIGGMKMHDCHTVCRNNILIYLVHKIIYLTKISSNTLVPEIPAIEISFQVTCTLQKHIVC